MAKVWIFQDTRQVKAMGEDSAPWFCGWYDPAGKRRSQSCGTGKTGKRNAEKLQEKRQAELLTGTYDDKTRKTWADFRKEYDAKILEGMGYSTRRQTSNALEQFTRIVKPMRMLAINSQSVAEFIAKRRKEHGYRRDSDGNKATISVATINKELRHLKAVFKTARKWGYINEVPAVDFIREPKKLPTYISPEDFAKLYAACDEATLPNTIANVSPADWWKAVIVFGYMTGWRISEILALRREDVDMDAATAVTRAEDNKGGRDEMIPLSPVVVEHLRRVANFERFALPWPHGNRALYVQFWRIQDAAKIKPARKDRYGFHDLRRAFASMNADRLSADALQALMRHKSYATTQRYIDMTRQLDSAVAGLFVPEVLTKPRPASGG